MLLSKKYTPFSQLSAAFLLLTLTLPFLKLSGIVPLEQLPLLPLLLTSLGLATFHFLREDRRLLLFHGLLSLFLSSELQSPKNQGFIPIQDIQKAVDSNAIPIHRVSYLHH